MTTVTIRRGYLPNGSFGDLYINGAFICHTVERPWLDNKANVSCIPEGKYKLEAYQSPSHGACYIVSGGTVDKFDNDNGKRWGILIHSANLPRQLAGCIAPVSHLGVLKGQYAGLSSKIAVDKLFRYLGEVNELIITHKTGVMNS